MDIASYVGPALRTIREKQELSQEEIAFRARLDRTYISGIERGRRNPSIRSLQRIADALGIKLDILFIAARKLAEKHAVETTAGKK